MTIKGEVLEESIEYGQIENDQIIFGCHLNRSACFPAFEIREFATKFLRQTNVPIKENEIQIVVNQIKYDVDEFVEKEKETIMKVIKSNQ